MLGALKSWAGKVSLKQYVRVQTWVKRMMQLCFREECPKQKQQRGQKSPPKGPLRPLPQQAQRPWKFYSEKISNLLKSCKNFTINTHMPSTICQFLFFSLFSAPFEQLQKSWPFTPLKKEGNLFITTRGYQFRNVTLIHYDYVILGPYSNSAIYPNTVLYSNFFIFPIQDQTFPLTVMSVI